MTKRTNTAAWLEKYNRWQIKVQKDGRRRTFTSAEKGKQGQRIANAKADEWLDENIDCGNRTIDKCLDEYIAYRLGTVAPETSHDEAARINNWLRPYVVGKRLSSLTEGDLQEILNTAVRKGLRKKSISNIRATMVQFIKYCRMKRYTMLTTEFLEIPRSAVAGTRRILQPNSLKKLFTCDTVILRGKRQLDIYVNAYRFAVLTGIRPGELVGLEWGDIDGDVVHLQRSINTSGRVTTGKNENARRSFVLTSQAKLVLYSQCSITDPNIYDGSVFGINSQSTLCHRWTRYCNCNDIPFVSLYELRHTFVSIAKRLPDGELRQLVGHSKSMDTYGIYSHELDTDRAQTAANLEQILSAYLPKPL